MLGGKRIIGICASAFQELNSVSHALASNFLSGAESEGAEVRLINISKLSIHECIGCYSCHFKEPYKCILNDDMTNIVLPAFMNSDAVVLATPIYNFNMTSTLKRFIDRLLPLGKTYLSLNAHDNDAFGLDLDRIPPIIAIATAACSHKVNFDLLDHNLSLIFSKKYLGLIRIYNVETLFLSSMFIQEERLICDTIKNAGAEYVKTGTISTDTLDILSEKYITPDANINNQKHLVEICKNNNWNLNEFYARKDKDIITLIDGFRQAFVPRMGFKISVSLIFTSEHPISCYIKVDGETIETGIGENTDWDIEIETTFLMFVAFLNKRLDVVTKMRNKLFLVKGNVFLLKEFDHMFKDFERNPRMKGINYLKELA